MMARKLVLMIVVVALSACGGDGLESVRAFVADSGKDLRGKVDPLPTVQAYEPFEYNAFDLPDPFKPRKLKNSGGGGAAPDLNRPREALESFPLESLKLVGTLEQGGVAHALIKAPDNSVHRVRAGNYLGQNFGMIASISEYELQLTEVVQDSSGDWVERQNALQLQE